MSDATPPSDKTRLRRAHQRGRYDRASIDAIVDATFFCHVGYLRDGAPAVTPTMHWREGDHVYWHGSSASSALRLQKSAPVCLTVTLIDGLVMARSAFHHSVNYRSVMLYGEAQFVDDPDLKVEKLRAMVERIAPGRWETLRPINDQEVKATTVLSIPIDEASAKIRDGGPVDDDEDYALPIWAGVVPLRTVLDPAEDDPRNLDGVGQPAHLDAIRLE